MSNILVIDAGNTSTTVALYNAASGEISARSSVKGGISSDRKAAMVAIRQAFARADSAGEGVGRAMLASVTPRLNEAWERLVREETGLELGFVSHDMRLPVKLDYPHPETTGADRIADISGAMLIYGAPLLVVDIGTAVTYDLLSSDGRFFCGVIGPGPEILAKSLYDYTALLPLVEWWKKEPPAMGKDTEGAMLLGIDAAFTGGMKETVARLLPLAGANAKLIATGGFASRFAPKASEKFICDGDLTLKGIGLLAAGEF